MKNHSLHTLILALTALSSSVYFSHATAPCKPHVIEHIGEKGIVITKSGTHTLCKDITYTGHGPAITVTTDGVTIDLCGHSIIMTNAADAILVDMSSQFSVQNGTIVYAPQVNNGSCSAAVRFRQAHHGSVDSLSIINPFFGVELTNSNDITVTRTFIQDTLGSNVSMTSGNTGLTISECSFNAQADSNIALAGILVGNFQGSGNCLVNPPQSVNYDFTLKNSHLYNSDILFEGIVYGARVDNVTSVLNDPNYLFTNFQIGDSFTSANGGKAVSYNVLVTNSSFSNLGDFDPVTLTGTQANPLSSTIAIWQAVGVTFDNVIIQSNSQGTLSPSYVLTASAVGKSAIAKTTTAAVLPTQPAQCPTVQTAIQQSSGSALTIGAADFIECENTAVASNTITIRNSTITGGSKNGIYITSTSSGASEDTAGPNTAIVIENNSISDAVQNNIFVSGTQACTIENNSVTGAGVNGIWLANQYTFVSTTLDSSADCYCTPAGQLTITVSAANNNIVTNNTVTKNGLSTPAVTPPGSIPGAGVRLGTGLNTLTGNPGVTGNIISSNIFAGNRSNLQPFPSAAGNIYMGNIPVLGNN
jgi:parallel beta-helix repeat protein